MGQGARDWSIKYKNFLEISVFFYHYKDFFGSSVRYRLLNPSRNEASNLLTFHAYLTLKIITYATFKTFYNQTHILFCMSFVEEVKLNFPARSYSFETGPAL